MGCKNRSRNVNPRTKDLHAMRALLAILLFTVGLPVQAQITSLIPRDDGAGDPSFITFRGGLVEIIARRDATALLDLFAPEAKLSFGGSAGGADGVREMWFDGDSPRSELWTELGRIVALGSVRDTVDISQVFDDGQALLSAPYVFAAWPDTLDSYEHGAIVGDNVRVRAAESLDSEILATLTYTTVPVLSWNYGEDGTEAVWTKIVLADGREGFVASRFILNPIGYRMGFLKRHGAWTIVYFLTGD